MLTLVKSQAFTVIGIPVLYFSKKADGQAGVWSDDDLEITNQKMEADTSVTAFIAGYIAHGRIVSKLSPPVFDDKRTGIVRIVRLSAALLCEAMNQSPLCINITGRCLLCRQCSVSV